MLPRAAREAIWEDIPKINPLIANGLATEHLKHVRSHIHSVWQAVAEHFPPGLKYLGPVEVSPRSEFKEEARTKTKTGKPAYDMAKSNVRMVGYKFQVNDDPPFVKYLYLPFCEQAGIIYLSGTRWEVSPVLADRVFSIGQHEVFLRLGKARVNIERTSYRYTANDKAEIQPLTHSRIHNNRDRGPKSPAMVKANTCLVHYLLAKYGFSEAFQKYLGFVPIVTTVEDSAKFNQEEYVVCRTYGLQRPKGQKLDYQHTTIALVIPKDKYTNEAKSFVAGFFYVTDHFPQRVKPEYLNRQELWRVLLGLLIWSPEFSEGRLLEGIHKHMVSLDTYHDAVTAEKLKSIGYDLSSFYDLLFVVIANFDQWQLGSARKMTTMYEKELNVLTFVCSDIVNAINTFFFKLDGSNSELTTQSVQALLRDHVRTRLVFGLNVGHGELSSNGTSGDNMLLRITNILVPQTASANTGKDVSVRDPAIQLDASIAEVGGYASLPKSGPDGRQRINPYLQISPDGLVLQRERIKPLLDRVQRQIHE